ncbi:MAG: hypothetical protein FWD53_04055, partial [Phycisphaerales bacterium]|nr:hypothetical protein [Phycisphaerales bacterium]
MNILQRLWNSVKEYGYPMAYGSEAGGGQLVSRRRQRAGVKRSGRQAMLEAMEQRVLLTTIYGGEIFNYIGSSGKPITVTLYGNGGAASQSNVAAEMVAAIQATNGAITIGNIAGAFYMGGDWFRIGNACVPQYWGGMVGSPNRQVGTSHGVGLENPLMGVCSDAAGNTYGFRFYNTVPAPGATPPDTGNYPGSTIPRVLAIFLEVYDKRGVLTACYDVSAAAAGLVWESNPLLWPGAGNVPAVTSVVAAAIDQTDPRSTPNSDGQLLGMLYFVAQVHNTGTIDTFYVTLPMMNETALRNGYLEQEHYSELDDELRGIQDGDCVFQGGDSWYTATVRGWWRESSQRIELDPTRGGPFDDGAFDVDAGPIYFYTPTGPNNYFGGHPADYGYFEYISNPDWQDQSHVQADRSLRTIKRTQTVTNFAQSFFSIDLGELDPGSGSQFNPAIYIEPIKNDRCISFDSTVMIQGVSSQQQYITNGIYYRIQQYTVSAMAFQATSPTTSDMWIWREFNSVVGEPGNYWQAAPNGQAGIYTSLCVVYNGGGLQMVTNSSFPPGAIQVLFEDYGGGGLITNTIVGDVTGLAFIPGDGNSTGRVYLYANRGLGANSHMIRIDVTNPSNPIVTRWSSTINQASGRGSEIRDNQSKTGLAPLGLTWNAEMTDPFTGELGTFLMVDQDLRNGNMACIDRRLWIAQGDIYAVYTNQSNIDASMSFRSGLGDGGSVYTGTFLGASPLNNTFRPATSPVDTGDVYIGFLGILAPNNCYCPTHIAMPGTANGNGGNWQSGNPFVTGGMDGAIATIPQLLSSDRTLFAGLHVGYTQQLPIAGSQSGGLPTIGNEFQHVVGAAFTRGGSLWVFNTRSTDGIGDQLALVDPLTGKYVEYSARTITAPISGSTFEGMAFGDPLYTGTEQLYAVYDQHDGNGPMLGLIVGSNWVPIGDMGFGNLAKVQGITFTLDQKLYVVVDMLGLDSNPTGSMLVQIDPSTGAQIRTVGTVRTTTGGPVRVNAMTTDEAGRLIIHDVLSGSVMDVSLTTAVAGGSISTTSGSVNPTVGALAVDLNTGKLYAVDNANTNVPTRVGFIPGEYVNHSIIGEEFSRLVEITDVRVVQSATPYNGVNGWDWILDTFGAPVSFYAGDTVYQPSSGAVGVYEGMRYGYHHFRMIYGEFDSTGDIISPDTVSFFDGFTMATLYLVGVEPNVDSDDASLLSRTYVHEEVHLGRFLVDGAITGKVYVSGSMELLYGGWIITGATPHCNDETDTSRSHYWYGVDGVYEGLPLMSFYPQHNDVNHVRMTDARFANNIYFGGDIRNIISTNSIGSNGVPGPMTVDTFAMYRMPAYQTGTEIYAGGTIGFIRTTGAFVASAMAVNSATAPSIYNPDAVWTAYQGLPQNEIYSWPLPIIVEPIQSSMQHIFSGIYVDRAGNMAVGTGGLLPVTRIPADLKVGPAAAIVSSSSLLANDMFGTPQYLGSIKSGNGSNIVNLNGSLRMTPNTA